MATAAATYTPEPETGGVSAGYLHGHAVVTVVTDRA